MVSANGKDEASNWPKHPIRTQVLAFRHGQRNLKCCASTDLALHGDAARVGIDDRFTLKHSDSQPAFLGGLKWTEERVVEELPAHPRTLV